MRRRGLDAGAATQVLAAGSFGGGYYRNIASSVTKATYKDAWKELPPDWLEGGALSMKPPGGGDAVEIAPVAGRLVLFFARLVEHEITPAAGPRRRLALQMWLDRSDGGAWPEEPLPGKGDPLDGDVAAAGGTGML